VRYSGIVKLECVSGDILFNDLDQDSLVIDASASSGLDQAPKRTPIYPRPATHGAHAFPFLKSERPIVLGGWIYIVSAVDESGYLSARDALIDDTISKLDELDDTEGTLNLPASQTIGVLSLGGASFPSESGSFVKRFVIPLVALDPDFA
jgi:hypothetical protein